MRSRPLAVSAVPIVGPAVPPRQPATLSAAVATRDRRLGLVFLLSLVWLLFEIGRPPTPPGIPLIITAILFFDWVAKPEKQLGRYWMWWLVLLGAIGAGVIFAPNTFAAYFSTRLMGTLFLGICLPLQGLITSMKRLRWWIYAFIAVAFYVGAWATTHNGYGPAASDGQDENYVAALMCMGLALAYFCLFTDKRLWYRTLFAAAMLVFVSAMALAQNPSRGGFVGLLAVALYCLARSPRKMAGASILVAVGIGLAVVAGPTFWNEIETTTDYQDGTGDMRLELWAAGMRMFKANPLLGVGAGNYRWVVGDYQSQEQFEKFGRSLAGSVVAHSMPVEMLAELGLLGGLATVVLVWSTWRGLGRLRPARAKPGDPPIPVELVQLGCYADAIRAAILAVLVNGTFLSLFYYSHLWILLAVGNAMPYIHRRILLREAGAVPDGTLPAVQVGVLPSRGLPHRFRGMPGGGVA